MKTVVQQIIEKFEYIQKNDCKTLPEHIFFDGVLAILESVYLDIEKQQIIDAYENYEKTYIDEDGNLDIKSGELFYKETFETNKETLK